MCTQYHKTLLVVGLIAITLQLCSTNTKADTVSLSGSVTYYGPSAGPPLGRYLFNFGGANSGGPTFGVFASGTSINGISGPQWGSWTAGMTVNLGSSAYLTSFDFDDLDRLFINGSSSRLTSLFVSITATPLTLPSTNDPMLVLTGPCSVTGGAGSSVGYASFSGSCDATLNLVRGSGGVYATQSVTYSLQPPRPQQTIYPEPTTVSLLALGLAGIAAKLSRRRKR